MNLKTFIRFTFLFSFILFFLAACDKEERKEYYNSGPLRSITTYRDSVKDGPYILYYGNGNVWEKGQQKNDEKDSAWNIYRENGKLKIEETYK